MTSDQASVLHPYFAASHCQGDEYGCGTTQGRSLRNSRTVDHLVFQEQIVQADDQGARVRTTLAHDQAGMAVLLERV